MPDSKREKKTWEPSRMLMGAEQRWCVDMERVSAGKRWVNLMEHKKHLTCTSTELFLEH